MKHTANQRKFTRKISEADYNCQTPKNKDPYVLVSTKKELTKLLAVLGDVEVDWDEEKTGFKVWAPAKADGFQPSDPATVPLEVKAAAFDKLHAQALEYYEKVVSGEYVEDSDHYHDFWEEGMALTLAASGNWQDMWKAIRQA